MHDYTSFFINKPHITFPNLIVFLKKKIYKRYRILLAVEARVNFTKKYIIVYVEISA